MSNIALFEGRPDEVRTPREMAAYDFLDGLGISYTRADHAPAETMEACEAIDEKMGLRMCKNLFLCNRQRTAFYLLLMPGEKPFATKELSGQLGVARLSFGSAEDMERLLGLLPGSVSVLGLINDREREVRLLVDRDLLQAERFGCHPLVNTSSLGFTTKELMEKVIPALGHTPTLVELGKGE
jgi:Ala-tRNA(Pro) deacylase